MKKLINDPADVVRDALQGMEAAHSDLIKVTYDPYTIVRKDAPVQGKVGIDDLALVEQPARLAPTDPGPHHRGRRGQVRDGHHAAEAVEGHGRRPADERLPITTPSPIWTGRSA